MHLPEPALWSSSLLVPAYDDSPVAPPDTAVRGQQVSLQPPASPLVFDDLTHSERNTGRPSVPRLNTLAKVPVLITKPENLRIIFVSVFEISQSSSSLLWLDILR